MNRNKKTREMTNEEYGFFLDEGMKICNTCDEFHDYLNEVCDKYGNYYKRACDNCYDKVEAEINGFIFDPGYAGERLEDY